ncbi:response regulator transcription factor [Glutamicibacter sp. PS]|uniref:response regulator transcription factor n=1 Tax=Glutamicibacter sp. PS TaxID=3075634 RepID=UPI00284F7744|nr:response regulator transcription factor [Glutamicibacter sp. PS]MDR4533716.1 response regulator transcription factor [Glutamicibacter sp. PS]
MSADGVLIVDDHSTVRMGLRLIVQGAADLSVLGEAADGRQAIAMAAALRPAVVLMDLRMPVLDGIAATRAIIAAETARVLVLTTFDDDEYLFGALQAGAHGFVLKSAAPEHILDALRRAARGQSVLAPEVTARVVAQAMGNLPATGEHSAPTESLETLTERELEVLRGLGEGLSNPQLAQRLGIGESTVKTHVSRVMAKLHVDSRLQAARIAFTQLR